MTLLYYAHRYQGFTANLLRAKRNFAVLRDEYARKGIVLWAPWIPMAEAGISEGSAWRTVGACIAASHGIVSDLDGEPESPGMAREREMATRMGKSIMVVA